MLLVRATVSELLIQPFPALLLTSLSGFGLHALLGAWGPMPFCGGAASDWLSIGRFDPLSDPGTTVLSLSEYWAAMAMAMAPLPLAGHLRRIWFGSLPRRRSQAILAFLCGQLASWISVGAILLPVAIILSACLDRSVVTVALISASIWHVVPLKRACLERAHRVPTLRVFGWPALADAFAFGARSAAWCTGSCWAIMLAVMVCDASGLAMVIATAFLIWERRRARSTPRPAFTARRWPRFPLPSLRAG